MIYPKTAPRVADHYDALDPFYRSLWGEHLHHGFWDATTKSPSEAVEKLVEVIASHLQIHPGDRVCDVGCGYGATARLLAEHWHVQVTGLTISQAQYEYAKKAVHVHLPHPFLGERQIREEAIAEALLPTSEAGQDDRRSLPGRGGEHVQKAGGPIQYLLCDWLCNNLPDASFDHLLAIESSEHMLDKAKFFSEAWRVLKPGGNVAICAWLAGPKPKEWEIRLLLEPICSEGSLASMGSSEEYIQEMQQVGFKEIAFHNLTAQVKKTWSICGWRVLKALACNPSLRHFVKESAHRTFLKTVYRIWLAYTLGSMQYGLFLAKK